MKKLLLSITILLLCTSLRAGDVEFYLDYARFQGPDDQPYVEVYLSIDATSVSYKPTEASTWQASVNIQLQVFQLVGKDSVAKFTDNYNLLSPQFPDTTLEYTRQNFVEMRRIPLAPGEYLVQVMMKDNQDDGGTPVVNFAEFELEASNGTDFHFSDLEFVARVTKSDQESILNKNGYEIVPFGINSNFVDQKKLGFYLEYYHADKVFKDDFYAQATILQGDRPLLMYDITRKKSPKPIDIFSGEFDIEKLPSQTYRLQVKLFNKEQPEGKVMNKTFYVANSKVMPDMAEYSLSRSESEFLNEYSEEQLDYYIKTLIHISTEGEIRFAKALETFDDKKNYLFAFWEKRLSADKTVEGLWKGHLSALDYTNEMFKSVLRDGWMTDRGRVFLQYGIPSDIERFMREADRLPHEIWKYDKLGAQAQVIFVFLDDDLATDEYPLIHSNKYGELQNFGWETMLEDGRTPLQESNRTRDDYEKNRSLIRDTGRN